MVFDIILITPQSPNNKLENFGNWEFWDLEGINPFTSPLSTPLMTFEKQSNGRRTEVQS